MVPVDPRYLGLWLTGLFGDPTTTDGPERATLDPNRSGRRRCVTLIDPGDPQARDPSSRDGDEPAVVELDRCHEP